jgi:hypothetical protein
MEFVLPGEENEYIITTVSFKYYSFSAGAKLLPVRMTAQAVTSSRRARSRRAERAALTRISAFQRPACGRNGDGDAGHGIAVLVDDGSPLGESRGSDFLRAGLPGLARFVRIQTSWMASNVMPRR